MIKASKSRPPWFSGGLAITQQEFFDAVTRKDRRSAQRLPAFFDQCADVGLSVERADSAMVLYWLDSAHGRVKFGTIFKNGRIDTNHICAMAREVGARQIGEDYLDGVAALIDGASALKSGNDMTWRVMKDGQLPEIAEFLDVSREWLELIEDCMGKFRALTAD
ncbi:MAG: hypothetical protein HN403_04475 [Rhodospirillales bacterium]|jgi:hypothetical protein|nr:hypothetical protein [Rhodospirillales bacterium]